MTDSVNKTIPADLAAIPGISESDDNNPCVVILTGPAMGTIHQIGRRGLKIGRSGKCDIVLDDDRVSRHHVKLFLGSAGDLIVQDLESLNGTFKDGRRISRISLKNGECIRVGRTTLLKLSLTERLEESVRRLYEASVRDGLTGMYNRGFFDERCEAELSYSLRHKSPLSLMMLDLDHFKKINDTYGHLAGDHVLVDVSEAIRSTVRAEDIVARYGGEEFVILAPGIDIDHALQMAERIRNLIEELVVSWENQNIQITISAGVTSLESDSPKAPQELIAEADSALYQAKSNGKNRVETATK